MAVRISERGIPAARIVITSRVMPVQMSQPKLIGSRWLLPALAVAFLTSFLPILNKRLLADTPVPVVAFGINALSLPLLGFATLALFPIPTVDLIFGLSILGSSHFPARRLDRRNRSGVRLQRDRSWPRRLREGNLQAIGRLFGGVGLPVSARAQCNVALPRLVADGAGSDRDQRVKTA
jgi:hypothetical protein